MKKLTAMTAFIAALAVFPAAANAYVVINGLIDVNHTWATYLRGAEANGDWTGAGYGYSMPSTIGYNAGNQIDDSAAGAANDGSWIQENDGGYGVWSGQGSIWDLGFESSSVDVFPFIDHVNAGETEIQEGTEFRVYGSNDLTSWFAATWTTSWDGGYRADAIYDNYTSRWEWGASAYRYIGIVSGNAEVGFNSTDAEIDAVGAAVPEPSSLMLLGSSALGLAGMYFPVRRRARRS